MVEIKTNQNRRVMMRLFKTLGREITAEALKILLDMTLRIAIFLTLMETLRALILQSQKKKQNEIK
jgi:hypothetical protein